MRNCELGYVSRLKLSRAEGAAAASTGIAWYGEANGAQLGHMAKKKNISLILRSICYIIP